MIKIKNSISKIILIFAMALMFGIMGHTNVHAATVGQRLTAPESGWRRFENIDKNISYIGSGWTSYFEASESGGNVNYTTNPIGASVRFNFTGNKIRIINHCNSGHNNLAEVYIDGVKVNNHSIYSSQGVTQVIMYQNENLSNSEHHFEYKFVGSGQGVFDAIDIDSNGQLKSYNENPSIIVSNITLNKSTDTLQVGETGTLVAIITPDNATNKNVKWISSDPSIATVDENGKVTAVKEGITTVSAITTDGSNLSASCLVTVKPKDTTPTNPTDNNGNAILNITMTNGNVKSYTVSMTKVNDFISWYNNRSSGSSGSPYYSFDKTDSLQPFTKKTEYVVFDKISSFEVDEYSK
ncbi:Ig-like domain-containing protein [Clostridium sp. OS1-26]|uniref:Ig-like domain-containing protein n=1 Tax=Clostridium sp. OS1-26 TaxID=3070681 RepID=UPI0027E03534|nr:Ig-like domain-containing protein [Clostridium sp. OS1-26]WML35361.1 Ig-like domain-containing protein [Clostridium sp. OS1-26]